MLEIAHPLCTAKLALHGAHLMEWAPCGHAPVLYCSPTAVLREGVAIRGGVPVCWPWFGAHPSDASQPAHGPVRNHFWELVAAESSPAGVRLKFAFTKFAAIQDQWPHACELELEMLLGERLVMRLITRNTGDAAFAVSGALHTYFRVGDVALVEVLGLEDAAYSDATVTPWQEKCQSGPLCVRGETTRFFHSAPDVVLIDPALQRRIQLRQSGGASTVVWNPGPVKGAAFSDLPAADVPHFLCIEAARLNDVPVTLVPGASHEMGMTVEVV